METPSREASDAGSATRRNPHGLGMSPGRGVYSFLDDLSPEAKREATIEDRAALLQLTKFRERLAAMGDDAGDGDEHDPPATPSDSPRTTEIDESSPRSPDENAPPGTGIPGMTPRKVHPSFTLPPHEQQQQQPDAAAAARTRGTSPSMITSPSGRIEVGDTTPTHPSPLGREPTTPTGRGIHRTVTPRALDDGTVVERDNDDGDGLTETHRSATDGSTGGGASVSTIPGHSTARGSTQLARSTQRADPPNDEFIVGRLLGSVEAALAEAATPRAALGSLCADLDECTRAIDGLREGHIALEREDGVLTEAQGQMREELDDLWRTRLPRLERLMGRLCERLDSTDNSFGIHVDAKVDAVRAEMIGLVSSRVDAAFEARDKSRERDGADKHAAALGLELVRLKERLDAADASMRTEMLGLVAMVEAVRAEAAAEARDRSREREREDATHPDTHTAALELELVRLQERLDAAFARVDSGVNTLRAETSTRVDTLREETTARMDQIRKETAELFRTERANRSFAALCGEIGARVAGNLEPCVDVVTALATRVLGPSGHETQVIVHDTSGTPVAVTPAVKKPFAAGLGAAALARFGVDGGSDAMNEDETMARDLLGASLVVLAAEAAHAIAPRGPCRVATRVIRAAVWTSGATLLSGVVKSICHGLATNALAEYAARKRREGVRAYGGVNAGVDDDTDTEDTDEERFETPPARSPADPDLFVDTH